MIDGLETIIFLQLIFELGISIVCFALNLYFASKFNRLQTFHPAFRRVLITTQIAMSLCTTIHPLMRLIPRALYSVDGGRIEAAIVFYVFAFIQGVVLTFASCKYAIIGLERHVGYKHRLQYEQFGVSTANWILSFGFAFALIISTLRCWASYTLGPEFASMDDRLQFTFLLDQNAPAMLSYGAAGFAAFAFAVYEFRRLSNFVKANYYAGSSLAESFTIKQTATIVNVLKPLITAFVYMMSVSLPCQGAWMYLYFFGGYSMSSSLIQTFIITEYVLFACYSIYGTVCMIWQFQAVRKALLHDLRRFFGLQFATAQVASIAANQAADRDHHFRQLDAVWQSGPPAAKKF